MEAMFIPLRETVELLKSNAIELDLRFSRLGRGFRFS